MPRVLILGGDADYNLGDAGILAATCESLVRADPSVQITVVSRIYRPGALPGVHAVLSPGILGWPDLVACAHRQDLIIFGGGGLLQDDDSRVKVPYWALRLGSLRALNSRLAGLCLGVGPLQHAESRRCAALICSMLDSISVRDSFGHQWLQRCTRRRIDIVPDPAFALQPAPASLAVDFIRAQGLDPGRPIVGVALRRWFHTRGGFMPHKLRSKLGFGLEHGRENMAQLIENLAAQISRIVQQLDASVLLLPSYRLPHEGDVEACRALAMRLQIIGTFPVACGVAKDPCLYKAVTAQLKLMISARMHPLIFAASMGVPIVGLAYNGKFTGLYEHLALERRLLELQDPHILGHSDSLEQLSHAALNDRSDLRQRCAYLAEKVQRRTQSLLQEVRPLGLKSSR